MITQRIRQIMEAYDLNARSFADRVGVQRSGMSHLFGGRNKPSLDLVLKIVESFPEVSVEWLLLGEGELSIITDTDVNILKDDKRKQLLNDDIRELTETHTSDIPVKDKKSTPEPFGEANAPEATPGITEQMAEPDLTDLNRIVLFFRDGTFENYKNRKP